MPLSPSDGLSRSSKYTRQRLPNFPLGFPALKGSAGERIDQALGLINSRSTRPAPGNSLIYLLPRGGSVG